MEEMTDKIGLFFVYFWTAIFFLLILLYFYIHRSNMKKYWKNLKHIFRHKWYVLEECCKHEIVWQGIVHDLSKFSWIEFRAYADNFFGDKKRTDFDYAWLHHQHKNKHHWNYWVVDQKKKTALPMPDKYLVEMFCDWKAMSRQFDNDIDGWFEKNFFGFCTAEGQRKAKGKG